MASELAVPFYEVELNAEPRTVCVTGGTGFVAGPIIQRLLAGGHTVHATVRDPSKEEKLADLKALPGASKRLKFFKGDLLEEGSFMEACKGCSVLFHTASPFFEKCEDSEVQAKLLDPALKGTINALNTANACDSVKRVVLTSSVAAIYDENKKPPYSEADWAVTVSATHMPYYYSKYLAEKKAWEMQKEQSRWDMVAINPSYVFGPPLGARGDGESIAIMSDLLNGEYNETPDKPFALVDVRDVAGAHCLAMLHPKAHGRNILCHGNWSVSDIQTFIKEVYPALEVKEAKEGSHEAMFTHKKVAEELSLRFLPAKQTIQDMVKRLVEIGRVSAPSGVTDQMNELGAK